MNTLKNRTIALLAVVGLCLFTENAEAANKRCGLGSRLFGWSKGVLSQVTEIATNGSFSGGSSIAYGTSGCKHDGSLIHKTLGKKDIDEDQILYAEANYEELLLEMSQGSGEVLKGFAMTLGCSEKGLGTFSAFTREHFNRLIPDSQSDGSTPQQLLNNISKEANQNQVLLQACDWV